jgi:hypothetical protein
METAMRNVWLQTLILTFCAVSVLGQNDIIGPSGEGSFITGLLGVPRLVLNEGGSWTNPLLVFKNSEIEIFIPDITVPGWAASYAEDFRENGTYFTYLYVYGRKSHRTICLARQNA